jgi:hypothetical protein
MTAVDLDLEGRRPILLTGMPRSGTTWVGRMLVASGEVGIIDEPFNLAISPGFFRVPAEHHYEYVTTETEDRYLPALARALEFDYPLRRELRRCRNRTDLYHTLRSWWEFVRSRGRRPLVKEPHAVFSAAWFAQRLEADVVVMVREPLAVVSSWKRLGWSFDFPNLLEQRDLMQDWLAPFEAEMVAALSPERNLVDRVALLWRVIYSVVADERFPSARLVRHEDISLDPVREYAHLYESLGLAFTDGVAKIVEASSSSENPPETQIEKPHETRIDSRANLENWKHRLSEDEIRRIRLVTEETAALYYSGLAWP